MPNSIHRAVIIVLLCAMPLRAQTLRLKGTVRDTSGAGISDAWVRMQSGSYSAEHRTDARGEFRFSSVPGSSGTVEVRASGFRTLHQEWSASTPADINLEIVLQPATAGEQVTVSGARTEVRLSDAPGSTVLLSSRDMNATPAVRVDDTLRQVPGFSLFRRSDSRTANASNQGVSLRGLGGSASSRALVLEDGLPLVDAFGGWVYWDRAPREELASIEVFRGGASNLYGSDALGGVVQFLTRQPEKPSLALETTYGNERTPDFSVWAGTRAGPWDLWAASEMFHTDGYITVPIWERGTVDTPANSEDATLDVNVGHQLGHGVIFGRGNFFTEYRHNGTPSQTNDTRLGQGAIGLDQQFNSNDSLTLRAYGLVLGYNQNFSSIASNRNSESLTDFQHVPEQVGGGAVQWNHTLGTHQTLVAGADLMEVMGASHERFFSSGSNSRDNASGGRQRILGFFGENLIHWGKWTVIPAARVDYWSDFNASSICTPVSGKCPSPNVQYPQRSDLAFSPRLSVVRAVNQNVALTGSIYRAFRAPTLNELYRTFRVANVLTVNNPLLNSERLTGAEAGANIMALDRKLNLRGTFFWSDIVDPVQNVTINPSSNPVLREKENVGRIRSRGVDLDGVFRINSDVQITAGYEFSAARVVNYTVPPGGVSLLGNEVAQVPRNVFTWEARYWNPNRLLISVEGRFVGKQFDDDQNLYPLGRFYTMDLQIGRKITRNLEIFAAAENIFDARYDVANTPFANSSLFNIGPPTLYRIGLRVDIPSEKP